MNSFQIIILSFFMSITVMSVSAQNNDSIKINNFSIEKNAQGDSVSLLPALQKQMMSCCLHLY